MRERGRRGTATLLSAVVHGAVLLGAWAAAGAAKPAAPMQVYRVDIVSPPPNRAGKLPAEPPSGGVAAAEPAPDPAPTPAPPEPLPAPEPAPEPPKPALPKPEPKRATPKPAPSKATPTKQPPAETARPKAAPAKAAPKPAAPAASAGAAAAGSKPVPATGAEPVASSPGGEGLSVRTEGARCPSEQYCNNIVRQVKRYFRRPAEARSDRGDVCFRVGRSGAVDDIGVERLRGSPVFKLALMEAVEQASIQREFGPLPEEFGSDWLAVCVEVSPAT